MNNLDDLMSLVKKIDQVKGEKEILITEKSPVTGDPCLLVFFGFDPNDTKQQQLKNALAKVFAGQDQV